MQRSSGSGSVPLEIHWPETKLNLHQFWLQFPSEKPEVDEDLRHCSHYHEFHMQKHLLLADLSTRIVSVAPCERQQIKTNYYSIIILINTLKNITYCAIFNGFINY